MNGIEANNTGNHGLAIEHARAALDLLQTGPDPDGAIAKLKRALESLGDPELDDRPVIRVLGPVEVEHRLRGTFFPSRLEARVLAVLAAAAPGYVEVMDVAEAVWGDAGTKAKVHGEINGLRDTSRAGLTTNQLVTRGTSYALSLRDVRLDLVEFDALIREGTAALVADDAVGAIHSFERALRSWRGEPLAGVGEDFALPLVTRLHDRHLAAQVGLCDAKIRLGREVEALPVLEALVEDHPLNERIWALLVLGLYRAARPTEALRQVDRVRGILGEHGLDLGEELRALYDAIFTQDASLAPTSRLLLRSDAEDDAVELAMYWGFRPAAHDDIRRELLECDHELVVAGLGLSTIVDVLSDPRIVGALAATTRSDPDFKIQLVLATGELAEREREAGGRRFRERTMAGRDALAAFRGTLSRSLSEDDILRMLVTRTYESGFIPRHFFLKVDASLYVGSYLSHRPGSHSYLIKLHDYGDGLYRLFADELSYVLSHTEPIDLLQPEHRSAAT